MDFYQILLDIMEERKLSIPEIARHGTSNSKNIVPQNAR